MKNTIITLLLLGNLVIIDQAQAKTKLTDVRYIFDHERLKKASDSLKLLRTFTDYFYELFPENKSKLAIGKVMPYSSGWCVGDAHPENFGVLLQEDSGTVFSINDLDDAGPCPVVDDFLRLLVSSRLYYPKLDLDKMIDAYTDGLNGKTPDFPKTIRKLSSKSKEAGFDVDSKDLDGKKLKRKKEMNEVSDEIKTIIIKNVEIYFSSKKFLGDQIKVIDVISTAKDGGGSGGLIRYELLCERGNGDLVHLELKELTTPAIEAVATNIIPSQSVRMAKTLEVEQGERASRFYNVIDVNKKSMFMRPKFAGNTGVNLDDYDKDQNKDIMKFEAYILGTIHSQSVDVTLYLKALKSLSSDDWESDVSAFTDHFDKKYSDLKK